MSDGTPADLFFDAAINLLHRLREEEAEAIESAGTLLADTVESGGGCSPSVPGTPRSPRRTSSTARADSP